MFGTLQPRLCGTASRDKAAYRRLYCGTCKALGDGHGLPSRATLTYDVVFFAAVVEALEPTASAEGTCRCPLAPVVHRPILVPSARSMQCAAALQMVLADAWLEDQRQDGAWLGRLRPLTERQAERAADRLAGLGFDPAPVRAVSAEQRRLEASPHRIPIAYAGPTAGMLASLFRALPRVLRSERSLPVADDAAEALGALGEGLGRAVYAIDALEDLGDDLGAGDFNPCLVPDRSRLDEARLGALEAALDGALAQVAAAFVQIGWRRHEALLQHVLVVALPARAARAKAAARGVLEAGRPHRFAWLMHLVVALWWWPLRTLRRLRARRRHRRQVEACETVASPMLASGPSASSGIPVAGAAHEEEAAPPGEQEKSRGCGCDCVDCSCDLCCCDSCCCPGSACEGCGGAGEGWFCDGACCEGGCCEAMSCCDGACCCPCDC